MGLGGKVNGVPRQDGFRITVASEVMAILCLASDLTDLCMAPACRSSLDTENRTERRFAESQHGVFAYLSHIFFGGNFSMLTDIEIAQQAKMLKIGRIAENLGKLLSEFCKNLLTKQKNNGILKAQ